MIVNSFIDLNSDIDILCAVPYNCKYIRLHSLFLRIFIGFYSQILFAKCTLRCHLERDDYPTNLQTATFPPMLL